MPLVSLPPHTTYPPFLPLQRNMREELFIIVICKSETPIMHTAWKSTTLYLDPIPWDPCTYNDLLDYNVAIFQPKNSFRYT